MGRRWMKVGRRWMKVGRRWISVGMSTAHTHGVHICCKSITRFELLFFLAFKYVLDV